MNRFRVLSLVFAFLFFYALIKPSVAFACTCASEGVMPDYGEPSVIGKEAWCACALSCNDTGTYANGGCTQAPPEPPSCKTTTICGQSVTGNSPSDCTFSCEGTNAKYSCTQSDNSNCIGAVYCAGENSKCAAPPPSCKTTTICGQSAAGNSPSDCTPRCEGTLATYYCEQSDNRACNGTIHCAGENSRCGGGSPAQTSQPTTRPTTRPTNRPTQQPTASPGSSGITVTKIQIDGQPLDLNGKLKITLPDTFKTLNPQTKIDVTYSDNTTKSFYLGFHYVAPPSATLALSPATGTFNKSCNFSLKINVDTGGNQTDGTDTVLLYDPSILSVVSINNGTIYDEYTSQTIDQVNGKIILSGLSRAGNRYSGQGTLATVNFKVSGNAPSGTTQVKFNFDPNNKTKTTDSNVVQTGTVNDILSSVTDGSYTIGTDSCTNPTPAAASTPRPVSTPTPVAATTPAPTPRPSPTLSPALRIFDLNGDSTINTFDPATFIKDWKNCPPQIDFDHNGKCNARDYSMLKNQL